ncbi:MAG TPA: amidophosphoribosyltransferase [Gaiellales bacterium]|jgi:amidophosphoribosyltransferase|nr:amidophosphoribosyltransferase [Gaiellales bacterium]
MCGVFGIYDPVGAPDRDVARLTFFGLYALQHRGQESAGIAVSDGRRVTAMKDMGLVSQVFDEPKLSGLPGTMAIGHARYSTTGSTVWQNAQPVVRHANGHTVALGHNGNLTNTTDLRDQLRAEGVPLRSSSDTEAIAALIAGHPSGSLDEAIADTMSRIEGAFAAVVLTETQLAGFRDPDGIRPLVVGRLDDAWVLASETCAFDLIGARLERELEPGELVVIDERGPRYRRAGEHRPGSLCIFEFIYFARPDSVMQGEALHDVRRRMGERLALEAPVEADVVIPVPDSGTPAAVGYAQASGIPFGEGLVKNRYVGRTFIQPDQALRERGVKLKFNALRSVLAGKRVVVVDDSIVRGSTTRKLVTMLFEAGALEVHLRVSSPPIISPCFYGIDMAEQEQLIASGRTVEEVGERLGATTLAYLSLEGLQGATEHPAESFCRACLTGVYPTPIPDDLRMSKLRFEPRPVEVQVR